MARKVTWTQSAWKDLEEIAEYIAKDSPHYAAAFVLEARDAARSLTFVAERGRTVPEFNDPGIRELFVRSYRLIYQVKEKAVNIIGLIHGARDLSAL
jgi:addiction module RelE/StbE family toxin